MEQVFVKVSKSSITHSCFPCLLLDSTFVVSDGHSLWPVPSNTCCNHNLIYQSGSREANTVTCCLYGCRCG